MRLREQLAWFGVLLGLLMLAMGLSWWLHAQVNYGYALWYDWLDLRGQIDQFGPQNRYISGFETLTAQAHQAAFNAIVQAVHLDLSQLLMTLLPVDASQVAVATITPMDALRQIQFTDALGITKALLREPEVVHLNDVAVLITRLALALAVIAVLTLAGLYALRHRAQHILWRWQGGLLLSLLLAVALVLAVAGFEAVFYQLHRWVFPDGHQWFFFYQDSLMSTMMKAPDLFAGIGASLASLGLLIYGLMLCLIWRQSCKGRSE